MSEVRAPRRAAATKAVAGSVRGTLGAAVAIDSPRDPINILIVDDEPKSLVVLQSILDEPDCRLVCAESAEQALLSLIAEQYALLSLDVRMAGMTGFELVQIIKERMKTAQAPIIFLTAFCGEDQPCSKATAQARSTTCTSR